MAKLLLRLQKLVRSERPDPADAEVLYIGNTEEIGSWVQPIGLDSRGEFTEMWIFKNCTLNDDCTVGPISLDLATAREDSIRRTVHGVAPAVTRKPSDSPLATRLRLSARVST